MATSVPTEPNSSIERIREPDSWRGSPGEGSVQPNQLAEESTG